MSAPPYTPPPLPIDEALPALRAALDGATRVVLQAPPGAGKTTRVPLALLDAAWLGGRTIVMLEPRRLAARAAARRMAATLGEGVGGTVGFRVRAETRVGPRTRIEVVTEGVLTRMLRDDAALERAGAVLFDEYHERSLQADLGLALVLELQQVLRDDLRVLVMSATLDGARVAALLARGGGAPAPVVTSAGRAYPVEVRWRAQRPPARHGATEATAAATVRRALDAHDGDVLVFLPGAAEIRRAGEALADPPLAPDVRVHALHGLLAAAEQDAAIAPSAHGERKVVLATSIAETSLTIEGVRVVVDAGLARVPRFAPRTGMTHLDTVRVSQAGAEQRRGRAGRVAPGVCYRLWPEAEHAGLLAYALPEILEADLAPLALELAAAGVRDPDTLLWLDPPPPVAYARARELLAQLDALTGAGPEGLITAHGRRMTELGLHPRLAHMVLTAPAAAGGGASGSGAADAATWTACALAALLAERDVVRGLPAQPAEVDVDLRLALVRPGPVPASVHGAAVDRAAVHRVRDDHAALLRRMRVRADGVRAARTGAVPTGEALGALVAAAYPDRVAQRRPGAPGRFLLRNGRGVMVPADDPLARAPYLAVAELVGTATERESRVALAASLTLERIEAQFAAQIVREDEVTWDDATDAVRARRVDRLGALILREGPTRDPDPSRAAALLAQVVRARIGGDGVSLDALGPASVAPLLRSRVAFARRLAEVVGEPGAVRAGPWPDWSDAALARDVETWLAPHLVGLRSWAEVRGLDFGAILASALTHGQRAALDALAPTHLVVPSGSRLPVDYTDPTAPTLAVRLQELFGLAETPRVGGGRVPVVLELLSPAHRPVQVTRDLAGFWRSSYFEVRRELRGRYPRHSWPEDPLSAMATRRAKPRDAGR